MDHAKQHLRTVSPGLQSSEDEEELAPHSGTSAGSHEAALTPSHDRNTAPSSFVPSPKKSQADTR